MPRAFGVYGGFDAARFRVDHQHLAAEITCNVDGASRRIDLNSMRRDVWGDVYDLIHLSVCKIHYRDGVSRVIVAPVNPVAIDGNVRKFVIGGYREIVRGDTDFDS